MWTYTHTHVCVNTSIWCVKIVLIIHIMETFGDHAINPYHRHILTSTKKVNSSQNATKRGDNPNGGCPQGWKWVGSVGGRRWPGVARSGGARWLASAAARHAIWCTCATDWNPQGSNTHRPNSLPPAPIMWLISFFSQQCFMPIG